MHMAGLILVCLGVAALIYAIYAAFAETMSGVTAMGLILVSLLVCGLGDYLRRR